MKQSSLSAMSKMSADSQQLQVSGFSFNISLRFLVPPKWNSLETVLNEIKEDLTKNPLIDSTEQSPILVLASNESTCSQLIDLVKFGSRKLCWIRSREFMDLESKPFNAPEPENKPLWPPHFVAFYDEQILEQVGFTTVCT